MRLYIIVRNTSNCVTPKQVNKKDHLNASKHITIESARKRLDRIENMLNSIKCKRPPTLRKGPVSQVDYQHYLWMILDLQGHVMQEHPKRVFYQIQE